MKKNSFIKKIASVVLVATMCFTNLPVVNSVNVVKADVVSEVFGVSVSCTSDNTIGVVWGQNAETMKAGYKYNVYVNGTRKLYEVPCAYYTINDVKAGVAEVKVTAIYGGIETAGYTMKVNVTGKNKSVEDVTNLYVFGGNKVLSVSWNVAADQKAAGYSYNVYVNGELKGNTKEGVMLFEGYEPGYYSVVVKAVCDGVESEGVSGYAKVKNSEDTSTPVIMYEVQNLYVFGGMNCLYASWEAGYNHIENNVKYNVYLNSTLVKENTTDKSISFESIGAATYSITVKTVYDGVETQGIYKAAKVKGDWFVTTTTEAATTTTTVADDFKKLDANWSHPSNNWEAYVAQGWGNDPEVSVKEENSNSIVVRVDKAAGMEWAIQLREYGKAYTLNDYEYTATFNVTSNMNAGTIRVKDEVSGAEEFFNVQAGENEFSFNYTSKAMSKYYIDLGNVAEGAELKFEPVMVRLAVPQPIYSRRLSDGKTVTVSSEENSGLNANNLTDGDMNTRWSSAWTDDEWMMIDLGEVHMLDALEFQFEDAYAEQYTVMFSQDGENWNSYTYKSDETCKAGQVIIRNTSAARYVKVKFEKRATQYGYSLYEFVVHGY